MRRWPAVVLVSVAILGVAPSVRANGHGPVFGAATPTLGKGGWQLDQAWMSRIVEGSRNDEQTLRTMISFGITEDLQISGSLPISLQGAVYMPRGRLTAMMSSAKDVEALVSWRFHRRVVGAGSRVESTVTAGVAVPLEEYRPDGMKAAPSVHVAAASGFVSRAHYFWIGGGYHRHSQEELDRMGDTSFVTAVYGYRPPFLRQDYPKPDLRFFVEAVAEHTRRGQHHGFELPSSGGRAFFVGPSALLLYKAYGLEAGLLFPTYQENRFAPRERLRFAANVSWFFWRNGRSQ